MIERAWQRVERCSAAVALFALASLVALPFLQVILRDGFNSPLTGLEEATRWGLIALVFMALPLLIGRDEQIRFPELVALLPGAARRGLERLTLLVCALALAIMFWAGLQSILLNSSTRTPTLNMPFWVFASPFLVGLLLTAIRCLWMAIRRAAPPAGGGSPTL